MARTYDWEFPLPRTHTGMLLGNARMGAMVWGEGSTLCITVGRVDLWDHRGGLHWSPKQNYAAIRDCLERGDQPGLRKLFEETNRPAGHPARPSTIPVGRIDLDFGDDCRLLNGTLDLEHGAIALRILHDGSEHAVKLVLDMQRPVLAISIPAGLRAEILRVPAWEYVGEELAAIGFDEPRLFEQGDLEGWTQMLPEDPGICLGYRYTGRQLILATERWSDETQAIDSVRSLIEAANLKTIRADARAWWRDYWLDVPDLDIPNDELRFLYNYGMFKFAGLTSPDGVAATLQGPWTEEYQMPPWSNDYHFNINVQMCYWPAYHGNRLQHLRPLFDLIHSWEPLLRRNAHCFLGIDDGYMLPHAVDDRCTCMGGFWTGTVDHGCTAWVAQMMYRYFLYTRDRDFLATQAYPFMKGAMRVYEEMLERDGDRFVLPVSVSPEYRGASMNAWGANASFQLACIHRLIEDLQDAAAELGEAPAPIWSEIASGCPKFCATGEGKQREIALWDGTPLEESHRHHSHLAGITPFDIFDWDDEEMVKLIHHSIWRWIYQGPGLWSGWCVPWASMIHSRLGNADAAELWLEIWKRVFTNEGHGTLHDVDFPGFSLMGKGATCSASTRGEIMQMDAGMSAVAAIQEMLVHERRGTVYLFKGAPLSWQSCGFSGMRVVGGFLLSARREHGVVGRIIVDSPYGGRLSIANPWGKVLILRADGTRKTVSGEIVAVETTAGEKVSLRKG